MDKEGRNRRFARDCLIHVVDRKFVHFAAYSALFLPIQHLCTKGAKMIEPADFSLEGDVLVFRGRLTLARIGDLPLRLRGLISPPTHIDISGIDRMDTVGAWIVHRLARDNHADVIGATAANAQLLAQMAASDHPMTDSPAELHPLLRMLADIGQAVGIAWQTLLGMLGFFGSIVIAVYNIMTTPTRFRWNAVIRCFEEVGVKALGIIGLMSLMIGLVIAQQGSAQLSRTGFEVWTINLIGRLNLSELGVLMTAIMVAGRSGSAFAAQIGTMKLTEEIDAMRTIGVSPIEALVLPRVLASTVMLPLLGFYSAIIAIIGGGIFCWTALGITPVTFVARLREVVPMTDLYIGLIKGPFFGMIIGMAGCFQGMLVESDAEQVGLKTTAAVVQAIFMVLMIDSFFAVFFNAIGWT